MQVDLAFATEYAGENVLFLKYVIGCGHIWATNYS